jgi:large subunit ribosomal protein L4
MPKVAVYNIAGQQTGEIELNENVFGVEVNEAVLHQAVVMQLASQRLGTAATKTRGMVRGGGRKPWKQKGTGRARAGSTRSPIWVGGGTTFGPQPRSYAFRMPRKQRRLAKALIVTGEALENVEKSSRNIRGVKAIASTGINVYDILYHDKVLITKDAVNRIEEVLA